MPHQILSRQIVQKIVLLKLKLRVTTLYQLELKIDIMEMELPVSLLMMYVVMISLKCNLLNVMVTVKEDIVHVKLKIMTVQVTN